MVEETIVYAEGGIDYKGRMGIYPVTYWKKLGYSLRQEWLYKGFRYFGGEKSQVVVYDSDSWDGQEIARRKANGFLGIRSYYLGRGAKIRRHKRRY